MKKLIIIIISVFIIVSCKGENQEIEFSDFKSIVQSSVSSGAVKCGTARREVDDVTVVNSCAAELFNSDEEFYAIYTVIGSGGGQATAVTRDSSGNVYKWLFSGFRDNSGNLVGPYSMFKCMNPSISGVLGGAHFDFFSCDEI